MSVEGGELTKYVRRAAFWLAIADTRTIPVKIAGHASPFENGPEANRKRSAHDQ